MTSICPTPRGPVGVPLVGHAFGFLLDKPGFLLRCRERFGETVPLWLGGPTLLVTAPHDVRHVLVTAAGRYRKSPRLIDPQARRRLGTGLFTLADADHARLRSQTIRCFHPRRIARCQPLLDRQCEDFARSATLRRSIHADTDIAPFVAACVVDVLLAAGESKRRPGWSDAIEGRRRADESAFGVLRMPSALSTVRRRPFSRLVAAAVADAADPDALLHELLDPSVARVSGAVESGIEQLLVAAYETTTMLLVWAVDLLARHPRWQEPCVDTPVADRVISEVLRLYPPTWLFVRVAAEPDLLPSGTPVPAGGKIYLSPYASQRTAAAFSDAASFDPDRFLPDRVVDPWRYFPFGAGGRSCLGEQLARRIGATFLTALMRRGRLAPLAPPPRPVGRVTLRPHRAVCVTVVPTSAVP